MTGQIVQALIAGALIAVVNGANDVSKGIATLVGSGVSQYQRACRWGACWTALGGLAAAVLAQAMVSTFGKGLLHPSITPTFAAALATILGAGTWVLLATRTGLPVSTTHAIVGSLIGVAIIAYGSQSVRWTIIGSKVIIPLLFSPVLSLALTIVLGRLSRSFSRVDCICITADLTPVQVRGDLNGHALAVPGVGIGPGFVKDAFTACQTTTSTRIMARITLDDMHWLTSGATSFARGLNDAPKMVALILAISALAPGAALGSNAIFLITTLGMLLGSLIGGRRVTQLLAKNVTRMDHHDGFAANFVTALLVISGAIFGLPMSTTHVSSGAILGIGSQREGSQINWKTVRDMALAWVITLPAAALLGIGWHTFLRMSGH